MKVITIRDNLFYFNISQEIVILRFSFWQYILKNQLTSMNNLLLSLIFTITLSYCKNIDSNDGNNNTGDTIKFYKPSEFAMGADLSYVNQILDHGGIYKDSGKIADPYNIFQQNGANVIRFRLFHTPTWTKEVYGVAGTQMYNDFEDVKKGISKSKAVGMQVCLDFHYSDTWADPSKQIVPAAWDSASLSVLHDSIYNYTYKVLNTLGQDGLMPEYVQIGNEINPGFLLPKGSRWNGNESNMIYLLTAGTRAVRNAGLSNPVKPKIIIHIAQPENVDPWFDGLAAKGLTDYDIIGISYYYIWSTIDLKDVSTYISQVKTKYNKEVMIMETAYPWTSGNADSYGNTYNSAKLASGYPASETGQYNYLKALTQEIIDGGGRGIFYWEPAWITSNMKDQWGTGSSWDNHTLFDFHGEILLGMHFMTWKYKF
jgi:arabinogalactan endo-1,4-beta-galactosidase